MRRKETHALRFPFSILRFLEARFGKSGRWYWNISQGIDNRDVSPDRVRKSIGAETTYFDDLHDLAAGQEALAPLAPFRSPPAGILP